MAENKLTALAASKIKTPGTYGDGGGLYLRVAQGRRSWFFRYKVRGVSHWMGLGPEGDYSLVEAREAARQCRRQLREGIDPIAARQAAKAAALAASGQTFEATAKLYIAAHKAGWKNEKHGKQWEATLALYAYPVIGELPVGAVTVGHVLTILEAIWQDKPETASRVRGRIENVLDYATARHWRTGENPARWKGHLDHLLPARAKLGRVEHHAALPWREIPATMAKLSASGGMGALCLRFLVLTAARSGEVRGMRWSEVDIGVKVWVVPGEKMKAGVTHRVPLSPAAIVILEAALERKRHDEGLVFPGGRAGAPLSDVALNKAFDAAGGEKFTVHGMRSAFRDWCAESTSYAREIAEAALAHTNRDKVEAAYLRGDHFEKRRRLMAEWGNYLVRPATGNKVTPLRGAFRRQSSTPEEALQLAGEEVVA